MDKNKVAEQYVSFETAKLLKERGFAQGCDLSYHPYSQRLDSKWSDNITSSYIAAPTQQVAVRWLRDIHYIHVSAELNSTKPNYRYHILVLEPRENPDEPDYHFRIKESIDNKVETHYDGTYESHLKEAKDMYDTYEFALEEALKYALKNLLKKIQ